ncbi:MAG: LysR family transcriptional regulator [Kofleriaceae bacterium]
MRIMQRVHISGIDLNLAIVLRALLDERSVSRAAKQLGLSQSATSHALARLRLVMQDPLFVRTRTGLVPTPRAEAIAQAVRTAVTALEQSLLVPPPFDPKAVRRTFHIRPSDYVEYLIVPPLQAQLAERMPNVELRALAPASDPVLALEQGELDLLVQPPMNGDRTERLHVRPLWEDRLVGVMRRGHPLARGRMTLARFAAARHALIAPRGEPGGFVDDLLRERGLERRVAYMTPSFLAAPLIVAATDLLLVLPARVAETFVQRGDLTTFEPPVNLPGFRIAMFWHDRHDADPAHRLLRTEIAELAKAMPRLTRPGAKR